MWGVLVYFILNGFMKSKLCVYISFVFLMKMFFFDTSWPCLVTYYGVLESLKISLIVLTMIIMYLMIFEKTQSRWLIQKIFLLGMMLVLCFSVCDMFIFFVFFELSLLPTVYMMFSWGVQPERLLASSYFLIYAILGSFPLLCKIIKFIKVNGSYMFILPYCSKTSYLKTFFSNNYLTVFWVLSFLMKLPVYSVHLWLPKAHVEAPVYGSMMLAAVLLKLGGYGLIRIVKYGVLSFSFFLFWVVLSALMVGLMTFRSKDIKSLMAYSSMSHMAFTLVFLYCLNFMSFFAVLFLLMGHGYMSSGMFYGFNTMYQTSGSRKMFLKKSNNQISSMFYFLFFFILCLNSSLPMNLTFFSEILVSVYLYFFSKLFLVFFFFSVLLVGLFKMNLFLVTNQGSFNVSKKKFFFLKASLLSKFMFLYHVMMNFFFVFTFIQMVK